MGKCRMWLAGTLVVALLASVAMAEPANRPKRARKKRPRQQTDVRGAKRKKLQKQCCRRQADARPERGLRRRGGRGPQAGVYPGRQMQRRQMAQKSRRGPQADMGARPRLGRQEMFRKGGRGPQAGMYPGRQRQRRQMAQRGQRGRQTAARPDRRLRRREMGCRCCGRPQAGMRRPAKNRPGRMVPQRSRQFQGRVAERRWR